jgi:carboxypeptidase family protein
MVVKRMLLLLAPGLLLAQSSGVLVGLLASGAGEAIGGARVVLTDVRTGIQWQARTDTLGIYAFSLLPASEYRLEAIQPGREPLRVNSIVLSPGEKRSLRLRWDTAPRASKAGSALQNVRSTPARY